MSPKWKSWFRVMPAGEDNVAVASGRGEPSLVEVLLMLAMVFAINLLTVCRVRNFWEVAADWLDNPGYLEVATVIRNWHFSGGEMRQHFWGFPYTIVGVSKLFSVPELMALVMISMLASLAVCILVHRLFGGWVAAVFIFINYEWIILSVEGGSEPLFMCLLYASFLAVRSSRWNLAALLASLSTTVRPVGVFALLCFAIVLARRRSYRQLAVITLIGLAIGVLYVVPLWIVFGSPFAHFIVYRRDWGPHGWPLTYPFGTLIPSYLAAVHHVRWKVLVYSAVWPVFALVGTGAMWFPRNRQRFSMDQPEPVFASIYTLFLVSYNYLEIPLRIHRFVIPVVPVLLFSLRDWIPRDRRVLWVAAAISALLSCAPLVYFKNVFGFRLP